MHEQKHNIIYSINSSVGSSWLLVLETFTIKPIEWKS